MLPDADEDVEIAGRPAVVTTLPFPLHAKARAVVDTRRHFDRDRLRLLHPTRAVARGTRIFDHLSRAAALRAGALHGEESALREADLSASAAAGAGHRLGAGLRAAALA